MNILLTRAFNSNSGTLGMMQINGVDHAPFFTLENSWKNNLKDSSIPIGIYQCKPYSGTKFKNVYEVCAVPNRTSILFHWGNSESDTIGCILVGLQAGSINDKPYIMQSRVAFDKFRSIIGDNNFELRVV